MTATSLYGPKGGAVMSECKTLAGAGAIFFRHASDAACVVPQPLADCKECGRRVVLGLNFANGAESRHFSADSNDPKRSSNRCRCSDRSNFGKSLDRERVIPADGGFPRGRRLRRDIMRAAVEIGGVMGQHEVEIGDVDVRLVPVD